MTDADGPLEHLIYDKPGHLIRRLQQIAVAVFLEEMDEPVTPVQYAALVGILAYPGIDQVRLAAVIGHDRTTLAGVIDRLETKGLVERTIPAHDKRLRVLMLTPEGASMLERLGPGADRATRRMLEPLSPAEQAQFLALAARIVWSRNHDSRAPVARADQAETVRAVKRRTTKAG